MALLCGRQRIIAPADRFAGTAKDVWSIIASAIAGSKRNPVINMGQGSFDYNPPEFLLQAAKESLNDIPHNQYSPTKGRPALRQALADLYTPLLGRRLDPETEVAITSGANEGMLSAFMGFIQPGDEVIVFEPFFDQYISNIQMAGGKVVYVSLKPPTSANTIKTSASDWKFDLSELEGAFTSSTKMIIVNSPSNPVGKVFSREELLSIADLCLRHKILILADEVYDKLSYVPMIRMASLSPDIAQQTLTVGSVGKDFYATGWRIGFLIGPPELIEYVVKAHTRICFVSVSPLQEAVASGYRQAGRLGYWQQSMSMTQNKMQRFNQIWDEIDLPYSVPDGGCFVLVNLSKVTIPEDYEFPESILRRPRDYRLAWFLINEFGVAAIPPSAFYTAKNAYLIENFLRFGVTRTDEALESAKERLRGLRKYIRE